MFIPLEKMSDSELRAFFENHKEDLSRLRVLSRVENVAAVTCDWIELDDRRRLPTTDPNFDHYISKDAFSEICELIRRLELDNPVGVGFRGKFSFTVTKVTFGNVSGGFTQGVVYLEKPPDDIVSSIDDVPPRRGRYYTLLEGNWYAFHWIDG